jgi:hypothetical protein
MAEHVRPSTPLRGWAFEIAGGQNRGVRRPEPRSPLSRAVAPVAAGFGFFAVLGLILWAVAALMAGEQSQSTTFTPDRLPVGNIKNWAKSIDENGPVIFPGLGTTSGERTLVLDHNGENLEKGWVVYYAYPADRSPDCAVEQVTGTSSFTDCEGRTIDVSELAPPDNGEYPIIEDRRNLFIDLGDRPGDTVPTGS